MTTKQLLFSVTAKDCEWQYYKGSGAGGQKRNKTSSGVRCVHPPSGASGESSETRSQLLNKQTAFKRMANSIPFKRWVYERINEIDRGKTLEKYVDEQLVPENLQIEIRKDGKWTVAKEEELT